MDYDSKIRLGQDAGFTSCQFPQGSERLAKVIGIIRADIDVIHDRMAAELAHALPQLRAYDDAIPEPYSMHYNPPEGASDAVRLYHLIHVIKDRVNNFIVPIRSNCRDKVIQKIEDGMSDESVTNCLASAAQQMENVDAVFSPCGGWEKPLLQASELAEKLERETEAPANSPLFKLDNFKRSMKELGAALGEIRDRLGHIMTQKQPLAESAPVAEPKSIVIEPSVELASNIRGVYEGMKGVFAAIENIREVVRLNPGLLNAWHQQDSVAPELVTLSDGINRIYDRFSNLLFFPSAKEMLATVSTRFETEAQQQEVLRALSTAVYSFNDIEKFFGKNGGTSWQDLLDKTSAAAQQAAAKGHLSVEENAALHHEIGAIREEFTKVMGHREYFVTHYKHLPDPFEVSRMARAATATNTR